MDEIERKAALLKEVLSDHELVELIQELFRNNPANPPVTSPTITEAQAIANIDAQIADQERTARQQQNAELVDICVPFDYKASINGIDWVIKANVPTKVPSGIKANLERILSIDKENDDYLKSRGVRREG